MQNLALLIVAALAPELTGARAAPVGGPEPALRAAARVSDTWVGVRYDYARGRGIARYSRSRSATRATAGTCDALYDDLRRTLDDIHMAQVVISEINILEDPVFFSYEMELLLLSQMKLDELVKEGLETGCLTTA